MKNVLIENATHYCAYTAYSNAFGFDLPYLGFSWSDLYQTNMRPPCNSLEHLASIKSLIPSILQCVEREREWYRLTFRISRANTDYRLTDMANVNENARNRNEVKSERMPNNASEERRTLAAKKVPQRENFISDGSQNPYWNRIMYGCRCTRNVLNVQSQFSERQFISITLYTRLRSSIEAEGHHRNLVLSHIWRHSLASLDWMCEGARAEFFNISHGAFEKCNRDWYAKRCTINGIPILAINS